MEWNTTWEDPLTSYVKHFAGLIGDQRTRKTFGEIVKGIITAGSLICQQIAAQSAELSKGKKGSQRVIRLATGVSTQRSELDAEHLTKRLREGAVEQLEQAPEDELWLIADGSDLRKPYAKEMPHLMHGAEKVFGPVRIDAVLDLYHDGTFLQAGFDEQSGHRDVPGSQILLFAVR